MSRRQINNIFSYFFPENRLGMSCNLSPYKETICMKCQSLFSGKNKRNTWKWRLLKLLPSMLSVTTVMFEGEQWIIFCLAGSKYENKTWLYITVKETITSSSYTNYSLILTLKGQGKICGRWHSNFFFFFREKNLDISCESWNVKFFLWKIKKYQNVIYCIYDWPLPHVIMLLKFEQVHLASQ